jgi:hypothetical protein
LIGVPDTRIFGWIQVLGNLSKMPFKIRKNRSDKNGLCRCGSGKKYKDCCFPIDEVLTTRPLDLERLNALYQARKPEPKLNIVPSIVDNNYRFRVIWNRVYPRRLNETFDEFIFEMLKLTVGKEWWEEQQALPPEKRHIIRRWFTSLAEFVKINKTEQNKGPGEVWGAPPTGEVQALRSLAYDLYCLQIVNKLPNFLVERLRDRNQYQGVRYEIEVAAIIARAGFDIIFLDDKVKGQKHCEFIAKHKVTGAEIGIEAKSRHRRGIIHVPGDFEYNAQVQGEFR